MTPFSLFEASVAFAQLVLLALVYHALRAPRRRRHSDPAMRGGELRVHVPELGEVAYSLNAMRTHLYQIGRALKQRRELGSLDLDACCGSDGSFSEKKKGD